MGLSSKELCTLGINSKGLSRVKWALSFRDKTQAHAEKIYNNGIGLKTSP